MTFSGTRLSPDWVIVGPESHAVANASLSPTNPPPPCSSTMTRGRVEDNPAILHSADVVELFARLPFLQGASDESRPCETAVEPAPLAQRAPHRAVVGRGFDWSGSLLFVRSFVTRGRWRTVRVVSHRFSMRSTRVNLTPKRISLVAAFPVPPLNPGHFLGQASRTHRPIPTGLTAPIFTTGFTTSRQFGAGSGPGCRCPANASA